MVTTVVVNFSPYSGTKRLPGPTTARAPVVASRPPARPVACDRAGHWVGRKFLFTSHPPHTKFDQGKRVAYGLRFRLPPLLAAYVTFLALPGVSALLDLLGVLELLLSLPYWASYLSSNHCLFLTRLPSFPVVHLETCNQRVL